MTAWQSDTLAADWLARHAPAAEDSWRWSDLDDAASEDPENAWRAILELVQRDLTEGQVSVLAAGPLELLLSHHGPAFIDRVEHEAAANARFDTLLGGVWKLSMSDEVWKRVQKARTVVW